MCGSPSINAATTEVSSMGAPCGEETENTTPEPNQQRPKAPARTTGMRVEEHSRSSCRQGPERRREDLHRVARGGIRWR